MDKDQAEFIKIYNSLTMNAAGDVAQDLFHVSRHVFKKPVMRGMFICETLAILGSATAVISFLQGVGYNMENEDEARVHLKDKDLYYYVSLTLMARGAGEKLLWRDAVVRGGELFEKLFGRKTKWAEIASSFAEEVCTEGDKRQKEGG